MPRRKTRTHATLSAPVLLAVVTLALFLLGEAFLLARSDSGQLAIARTTGIADWNRVTLILGRQLRQGMHAAGIPDDSLTVSVDEKGGPSVVWRMGLVSDASLLHTNFILTRFVEQRGGHVLSGRESTGPLGESIVTLVVGLPRRATHRVLLVRAGLPREDSPRPSRLAIVVYGFGEDETLASSCFALPAPFAVAIPPGARTSGAMFKAAHAHHREIVLQLPLEPINYPQVDPGPGTLLVTMPPGRVSGLVHRYIEQGRPLIAVSNHMGSLATQDVTMMTAVYRELRRTGLPFVHVMPAAGAVCKDLAADLGVAYNEPDAVVDMEARQTDLKPLAKRWSAILEEARGRDKMVVWVRATPLTLRWLAPALQGKLPAGVHIVPLSFVIKRPVVL